MSYQALYRRFRPKTFDEVFGQEHVTTVLKNQLKNDNIAHAYLFSGTRGTGKTSTAKIFSRVVNCLSPVDGNPCNECEVCESILDNSIMDVVEMDAASNNSVEDVRDLREKVKYLPSKAKYKVYIIDEVHMLSKGAFNALLKTLEEPPKHLIFILATTEPQKLPATILSRCQRFDFKRLTTNDLIGNMNQICDELNIEVEEKGLKLIARNSDGAMRDALSILEQCVSFSEGEITYDYILSTLGIVNNDLVFDMADNIINRDVDKTLKSLDAIVQNGKDIIQFIKDLISHFRNIMIAKATVNVEDILEGTDETIKRYNEQSEALSLNNITRILNILSAAETGCKYSSQPRVLLEVNLIKLISADADESVEGLINRIEELENIIKEGKFTVESNKQNKVVSKPSKVENINKEPAKKAVKEKPKVNNDVKEEIKPQNEGTTQKVIKDVDLNSIIKKWPDILQIVKKKKISLQALLVEGQPMNLENNVLSIGYKEGFGFHKDAIDKPDNKIFVESTINDYLGTDIRLNFTMENEINKAKKDDVKENNELVDKAIEVFGKDLVEVE